MALETGLPGTPKAAGDPIRVMVVDDSAVVRGLVTRMLEEDQGVQVTASVGNGQMALSSLERNPVDVIVLDIEMPVMDGMAALPKLLKIDPDVQIIMSSTLTLKGADVSLRAMEAGAADYIPKPTSTRDITGAGDFKRELVSKVKALGQARRRRPQRRMAAGAGAPSTPSYTRAPSVPVGGTAQATPPAKTAIHPGPVVLRPASSDVPDIIAIGSSTGGPQALFAVLGTMKAGTVKQPILITQHMPATFTTILAEHISRLSGWAAAEAVDGEPLRGGRVYVAPGDFHMVVETRGAEKVVRLNKNPPENFCRPSVDPMLRSLSAIYGRRVFTCILTGMGSDGLKGSQAVVAAGGTVIAQDEATSVVWGMPGAVATAGVCSAVLPLKDIANHIIKTATRRA